MVVELRDGSLMMLVRTTYGIARSVSRDRGLTWEKSENSGIPGPNSRFFIRRLKSGRLLLVNHHGFTLDPNRRISGRTHLAALLSEDDGRTWSHSLMLDEREGVSYPDGVEAPDGRIYITYDRERHAAREILMAVFTEEDILSGRIQSSKGRLRVIVDRAGKQEP
jgi:predicted neuraminidase